MTKKQKLEITKALKEEITSLENSLYYKMEPRTEIWYRGRLSGINYSLALIKLYK